jgi:hypothetical protein
MQIGIAAGGSQRPSKNQLRSGNCNSSEAEQQLQHQQFEEAINQATIRAVSEYLSSSELTTPIFKVNEIVRNFLPHLMHMIR